MIGKLITLQKVYVSMAKVLHKHILKLLFSGIFLFYILDNESMKNRLCGGFCQKQKICEKWFESGN